MEYIHDGYHDACNSILIGCDKRTYSDKSYPSVEHHMSAVGGCQLVCVCVSEK